MNSPTMVMRHVCTTCGGQNVFCDASQNLNDPDDVRVYDATFCDDCEGECKTEEREVPA